MSGRSDIVDLFERRPRRKPVVCLRLSSWLQDAKQRGGAPEAWLGMTEEELQLSLGFAVAARFRGYVNIEFPGARRTVTEEGGAITTTLELPGRTLTSVSRITPEMASAGLRPHLTETMLKSDDDYRALIAAFESAEVACGEEAFRAFDEATGESGLPMLILGCCPAHLIAITYLGYERFFLDQIDRPELLDALIDAVTVVYRERVWPRVEASSARLLLHGAHFSQSMTPPPIFERWFAPYFEPFNARMREAGKWVCFHSDADLGRLIPRAAELGFDCADCLATTPLVSETLQDYVNAWDGKVVAWGGLPSVIFDASFPRDEFDQYVRETLGFASGRGDVIIGVGDMIMPGAEWERLAFLSEALATCETEET